LGKGLVAGNASRHSCKVISNVGLLPVPQTPS